MPETNPDVAADVAADVPADEWSDHVDAAIGGDGIRSVYQPIVDLQRRTIVGYEALTRFQATVGRCRRGPDEWFRAAHRLGRGAQLEAAALALALRARPDLPRNCFLTLNVEPESLLNGVVLDLFRSEGHLGGVVVEITEHRPWDWIQLAPIVRRLRSAGAMFAVDDAGSGYSGLQQILHLRPDILKLDRSLIDGIDHDEAKRALVEMLGLLANRLDAWVLAEGVETPAEARTLVELEVPLAQGFYFARPAEPWAPLPDPVLADLREAGDLTGATLHRLVRPVASIRDTDDAAAGWLDHRGDWIAVVDGGRRPLGLLDAEAALAGFLLPALTVNVHSSPREVGQRLATSDLPMSRPVLVTDNAGRYLGLIGTRQLVRDLAS